MMSHAKKGKNRPPEISLVVPVLNEAGGLDQFHQRASRALAKARLSYEILFIDDGSSDDSAREIEAICGRAANVRGIVFSRRFGKEAALSAGLAESSGAWVVPIDADLQDPPELIPDMLRTAVDGGFDMVFAKRRSRSSESRLRVWSARMFYHALNWTTGLNLVPDSGDFRVMSRAVVDAVNALPEKSRFMKGLFQWVGFRQAAFPYDQAPRFHGESKWTYATLIRFGWEAATGSSPRALQLFGCASSLLALLCAALACGLALSAVFWGKMPDIQGWIPVGGLLLASFVLVGGWLFSAYMSRIFDETKNRPLYVVAKRVGFGSH
ncbi:MAG: glycosyltransferase family 2 protein [Spirochaetia bacterium]|nr:glycosyltransferase family 2 protein [Spirochaetia bacterium]